MHQLMGGWMDRQTDGHMDRWMDGWVGEWVDGLMDRWIHGWVDGWMDREIKEEWADGRRESDGWGQDRGVGSG